MKNSILLFITIILVFICILSFPKKETQFFSNIKNEQTIYINLQDKTKNIIKLPLEKYVIGVVAAEMPASYPLEALKAQAIASRSYAIYKISNTSKNYDVTTDIS